MAVMDADALRPALRFQRAQFLLTKSFFFKFDITVAREGGSGQTHLVGQVEVGLGAAYRYDDGQIAIFAGNV